MDCSYTLGVEEVVKLWKVKQGKEEGKGKERERKERERKNTSTG